MFTARFPLLALLRPGIVIDGRVRERLVCFSPLSYSESGLDLAVPVLRLCYVPFRPVYYSQQRRRGFRNPSRLYRVIL